MACGGTVAIGGSMIDGGTVAGGGAMAGGGAAIPPVEASDIGWPPRKSAGSSGTLSPRSLKYFGSKQRVPLAVVA